VGVAEAEQVSLHVEVIRAFTRHLTLAASGSPVPPPNGVIALLCGVAQYRPVHRCDSSRFLTTQEKNHETFIARADSAFVSWLSSLGFSNFI